MARYMILVLVFFHAVALADPRVRPSEWATPVIGSELENLYQVDRDVYRSEQPEDGDLRDLSKFGVTEVLNLREYNSDDSEAEGIRLKLHRVEMDTGSVSEAEIIKALSIIQSRKGPILIHCWHGSDRTGVTIAAYRVIFNEWSKEQALDEMINGGYGYHASVFPNLVKLIENLNVRKVRHELGNHVDCEHGAKK